MDRGAYLERLAFNPRASCVLCFYLLIMQCILGLWYSIPVRNCIDNGQKQVSQKTKELPNVLLRDGKYSH